MLKSGILNPQINALLSRVRHTNTLVIADRGFPYWPALETVDISLIDDVPTVLQVLKAIRPVFVIGRAYMADEYQPANPLPARQQLLSVLEGVAVHFEPHEVLKQRVPRAIGLIRTADTAPYSNIVLESA